MILYNSGPRGPARKDSAGLPVPAARRWWRTSFGSWGDGDGETESNVDHYSWQTVGRSMSFGLWREGEAYEIKGLRVAGRSGMDARRALCRGRGRDGEKRE